MTRLSRLSDFQEKCALLFEEDIRHFAKHHLDSEINSGLEFTLYNGIPANCVLLASLNNLYPSEDWDMVAHRYLESLNNRIELNNLDLSLYQGLCGLGASVLTMSKGNRYSKYLSSLNEILEHRIEELLDVFKDTTINSSESNFDVVSGFAGIIRYMLFFKSNNNISSLIQKLLTETILFAESEMSRASNLSIQSDEYVNLGTAHGLSGILSILSIAKLEEVEVKDLDKTIIRMISFFEEHSFVTMDVISFPERIPFSRASYQDKIINSSWCYGLSGVNRTLILAAEATGNLDMKNKYTNNYLKFLRTISFTSKITSTIFCHGLVGIIYEAFLIHQDSNEDEIINHMDRLLDKLYENTDWQSINHFPDCTTDLTHIEYNKSTVDGSISVYLVLISLIRNNRFDIDWIFLKR